MKITLIEFFGGKELIKFYFKWKSKTTEFCDGCGRGKWLDFAIVMVVVGGGWVVVFFACLFGLFFFFLGVVASGVVVEVIVMDCYWFCGDFFF